MSTLLPASSTPRWSVGRLTTVARTRIAHWSHVAVPLETTIASL